MLSFFIVFSFLLILTESACPQGSLEWNTNCYIFQTNATQFATAEVACKSLSGHLTSIHDGFTNAFLVGEGPNYFHESTVTDFWLGATKLIHPGKWEWTDNTTFDFNDWASSEPANISGSNCLALTMTDGTWKAVDCFEQKPYVCQIPTVLQPPPFIDCGYGWAYFQPTESCYGIDDLGSSQVVFSWYTGEQHCNSLNAHLASIHSIEEYNFIEAFVLLDWWAMWIGLSSAVDGHLQWTDGTPVDYRGFPGDYKSGCGLLRGNGVSSYPCNISQSRIICKKPAKPSF